MSPDSCFSLAKVFNRFQLGGDGDSIAALLTCAIMKMKPSIFIKVLIVAVAAALISGCTQLAGVPICIPPEYTHCLCFPPDHVNCFHIAPLAKLDFRKRVMHQLSDSCQKRPAPITQTGRFRNQQNQNDDVLKRRTFRPRFTAKNSHTTATYSQGTGNMLVTARMRKPKNLRVALISVFSLALFKCRIAAF